MPLGSPLLFTQPSESTPQVLVPASVELAPDTAHDLNFLMFTDPVVLSKHMESQCLGKYVGWMSIIMTNHYGDRLHHIKRSLVRGGRLLDPREEHATDAYLW